MQSRHEITIEDMPTLRRLARDIEASFVTANYKAEQAKQMGRDAIKEALLCGALLIQAKALVPSKQWNLWLKQCCPKIARNTAWRWMKLAKESTVKSLDDCAGLRQAYIACGIWPEPEPGNASPSAPLTPDSIVRNLSCLTRHAIGRDQVLAWPEEQRARFLEAARAIVVLYNELGEAPPLKESIAA